ncbi:MAG: PAS domain-containing protein [Oligoflexales bacterium]|nr:PAS domain-containing protein [Oligoflexales bacterium]
MKEIDLVYELKLKRAAEKDWAFALSSIKDFIVFTDIEGRYEFVNRIIAGLDHTRESILGLSFKEFVPECYHPRIISVMEEVKRTKQQGFYHTEGTGPNGKKSYYHTQVSPRIIDNEVIGFVLCARDVTDEHHEKEKWRSLVESCPNVILTVESDLKVSFINRTRWLGKKSTNAKDHDLWSFIPQQSQQLVLATLKKVERSKSIDGFEIKAPGENREETWYAVTVGPRLRESQVVGYTLVAKDIGPLRYALEEAKKSNAAKTRFVANISHELRTPLTSILGHSELLQLSGENVDIRNNSLQSITRNCKQLIGLIDDILALTNVEGRRDSINFGPCNPAEEAGAVVNQYKDQAQKKGINLSLNCAPSIPSQCITDSVKLKKILSGLIANSIKFTKQGSISLTVKSGQNQILFACKDTGVGILPENFEKIFEPFVQAYDHCDREFGGAGLGLTISSLLAKAINGRLVLQNSEIGSGSHFLLSIPNIQVSKASR